MRSHRKCSKKTNKNKGKENLTFPSVLVAALHEIYLGEFVLV